MKFKTEFYRLINPITGRFSFENFSRHLPFQDLILVYHLVSDEDVKHAKYLFPYRSAKQFENDLDFLSNHFDFIDWETFVKQKTENARLKKPTILLTFDDGYSEFYDIIAPILKRKGIFAINFINPKFIDNKEMMWRNKASLIVSQIAENQSLQKKISQFKDFGNDAKKNIESILKIKFRDREQLDEIANSLGINFDDYLKKTPVYLNSQQLVKLKNDGFGISSHGWDHPLYNGLTLSDQLENTEKSLHYMQENQLLEDSFAFPFTDHLVDKQFFETLFSQNPSLKFTFGAAGLKLDSSSKNLQRIPMETNNYTAEELLKNEIFYNRFLKLFNKNKIIRS